MKLIETYHRYHTNIAFIYTRSRYLKNKNDRLTYTGGKPPSKENWISVNGYTRIIKK